MATLWVREYKSMPFDLNAQIPSEPGTDQTVTFTTTVASNAFGSQTRYITIIADAAFHYVVGAAPEATTAALLVPADTLVSVAVSPGHKIAAVTAA